MLTYLLTRSKLYDKQLSSVPVVSGHHSTRSCEQDVEKVVKTVLKGNILTQVNGRTQLSFCVSNNPLKSLKWVDLLTWINKKHSQASKRKGAVQQDEVDLDDQELDMDDRLVSDVTLLTKVY